MTQGAVDRALGAVGGLVEYQLLQTGPEACRLLLRGGRGRRSTRLAGGGARGAAGDSTAAPR